MANLKELSKEWHLATALYDAIDDANLRQAASLLLEKHANPNLIIPDYGITPFHLAVGHEKDIFSKEVTKLLLKNGGDPNVITLDGVTPLHVAVAWNRSVIVRLLLSYGADPWILDDAERNSFHYAFEEHAWDALRTLEIFRRTRNLDTNVDGKKNYTIELDKVIIHNDDVQAEYKPHYHASCCIAKSKQNVGTQTPSSVIGIQPFCDSPKCAPDEDGSVHLNLVLDDCHDWCQEARELMITDDCKRKIMIHRSRSKVYEFSPAKRSVTGGVNDELDGNIEQKFSDDLCCCCQNNAKFDTSDSKEDSFSTVREKAPQTFCNVEVQSTSNGDVGCYNKPRGNKIITSPECILFSEESLFSDDQSNSPLTENNPFEIKTFTSIDESTSVSSLIADSSSRKERNSAAKELLEPEKCEKFMTKASGEDLKVGSWSRCLRHCACIPKRMNDSDSFSAYQSRNSKFKSDLPSGVDVLPEHSVVGTCDAVKYEGMSSTADLVDSPLTPPIDPNISIELKYTDEEDGIEFIEAKLPLSTSLKPTSKLKCDKIKRVSSDDGVEDSEPSDVGAYDTDYIRKELKKVGFISGPIAGTPTKRLYLKKLKRIRKTVASPVTLFIKPSFSSELEQVLKDDNWLETLSKWAKLENDLREHFLDSANRSSWRNGTAKTSFTYLLLDSRISNNLPARCEKMNLIDVWRTFTKAVFYIGKGTRSRPYEHLHEAFLVWGETKCYKKRSCSLKVKHILDIWKDGLGVVCLQAFHDLIPAEAFTREAAMIDAIGLPRLKNEKCGMYYGVVASWNSKMKKRLGAFLLYRALRIFIAQNEVQLKPTDVK